MLTEKQFNSLQLSIDNLIEQVSDHTENDEVLVMIERYCYGLIDLTSAFVESNLENKDGFN